jgi:hypothetical protein
MTEAEVNALMSSVDETFWKQAGLIIEALEKQPPLAKLHPHDQILNKPSSSFIVPHCFVSSP